MSLSSISVTKISSTPSPSQKRLSNENENSSKIEEGEVDLLEMDKHDNESQAVETPELTTKNKARSNQSPVEKKMLFELNNALNKCRTLVTLFNHSTQLDENLLKSQEKNPLNLINYVKTY